jgi:serine/threonine protein phosphatase 1
MQCLERAGFDRETDRLICLGDASDGWPEVAAVMELLAGIKNLIYILGNHDYWTLEWISTGKASPVWLSQGGQSCVQSYPNGMPGHHKQILEESKLYLQEEDRLFVHGGFFPDVPLEKQPPETLLWNRDVVKEAVRLSQAGQERYLSGFREVFVGHTPTLNYGSSKPIHACEFWLMDTGAGWTGPLSMMELGTGEIFQGDPPCSIYPESSGRM